MHVMNGQEAMRPIYATRSMYGDYMHCGKSLYDWQKDLNNEFSLGELYRLATEGCDFPRFVLRHKGIISEA